MKKACNGRNECEVGVTFFNSHSLEIDPFVALSYAKKKQKLKCGLTLRQRPKIDSLDIEKIDSSENLLFLCTSKKVTPSNGFGDPCPNVYKYMEVHFECVSNTCFAPLLQNSGQNGAELSGSSGSGPDGIFTGIGWTADTDDISPWLQYTPPKKYRLWAISTWGTGAGDETGKWVEEFIIKYQSHSDDTKWYDYSHNYIPIVFKGNSDPFSEKHHQLGLNNQEIKKE